MKRDILLLCQYFYPEYNSSARLPYDTACFLAKKGFSVDVLSGVPKDYCYGKIAPKKQKLNGINIKRISYMHLNRTKKIGRIINLCSFTVAAMLRLFSLRKYRCIIVYSNPPILPLVAALANKLFKTKFVFIAYDIYPEIAVTTNTINSGGIINRGFNFVNKIVYSNVDRVVALTDDMRNHLITSRAGIDSHRIITIPNWAYEEKTLSDSCEVSKSDKFTVSYFGNMGACQELNTLLECIKEDSPENGVKYFFAGHGSLIPKVKNETEKFEYVEIENFLTGESFSKAMRDSSCCIVSLENGLSNLCAPSKYYSYLYGGKPILSIMDSNSYLAKEIEKERIGFNSQPGDVKSLQKAIRFLKNNPDEYKKMCERSYALYKSKYARNISLQKFADMLRKLIDGE